MVRLFFISIKDCFLVVISAEGVTLVLEVPNLLDLAVQLKRISVQYNVSTFKLFFDAPILPTA